MTENLKKPIEEPSLERSKKKDFLLPPPERSEGEEEAKPLRPSLSLGRLKRVAEELKKTGVKESRKENLIENGKTPNPEIGIIERPAPQKGEIHPAPYAQNDLAKQKTKGLGGGVKIAETALSDLIQEKMKLEKILQELNNLKSKICQRIGLIKTIERRENELNQQLASVRKENDFSDQIEKRFENLKENIK